MMLEMMSERLIGHSFVTASCASGIAYQPTLEVTMAGRGAPTYLKRQKEQKRMERAAAKREARRARRDTKAAGRKGENPNEDFGHPGDDLEPLQDSDPTD
jgi:hypothetical protein